MKEVAFVVVFKLVMARERSYAACRSSEVLVIKHRLQIESDQLIGAVGGRRRKRRLSCGRIYRFNYYISAGRRRGGPTDYGFGKGGWPGHEEI